MQNIQPKKWLSYIINDYLYITLFTVIALFSVIPMLYFIPQLFLKYFLVWGLLIIVCKIFLLKKNIFKQNILLSLFLLSYCITILLRRGNVFENVQTLLWTACFIYIFLDAFSVIPYKKRTLYFKRWAMIIIIITFLAALISCLMYLTSYLHYIEMPYNKQQPQGLWGNRLVGVYREANFGCLFAIISIGLSLFCYLHCKKKCRIFLVVNIVTEFLFSIWTLSRGGAIAMSIFILSAVFFTLYNRYGKVLIPIVFSLLSVGIYLCCFFTIPKITGFIPPYLNAKIEKHIIINDSHRHPSFTEEKREQITQVSPDRTYDKGITDVLKEDTKADDKNFTKDISTGRLAVWKDAFITWLHHPVFGVGDRNISLYAQEVRPGSMLSKSYSVHNSFIRLLLSSGAVGFLVFMIWGIHYLFVYIKRLIKVKSSSYVLLLSMILSILAGCFFLESLFLYTSAEAVIFWVIIGFTKVTLLLPNRNSKGNL